MYIPKPNPNLKYQYIVILAKDKELNNIIKSYSNVGWIFKGKDIGYPYKLYFEYPKTDFDIAHFAMYESGLGNIL